MKNKLHIVDSKLKTLAITNLNAEVLIKKPYKNQQLKLFDGIGKIKTLNQVHLGGSIIKIYQNVSN